MSNFSENLKKLRTSNNLTQIELAELIGISKSAVSMYENSQREPSFEILEAIADHFNIPMGSLISSDEIKLLSNSNIKTIAAHAIDDLDEEQIKKVIEFAKFIKSQQK